MLGDGNFDGLYQRPDAEMLALWEVAVAETRAVIADGWRTAWPDGQESTAMLGFVIQRLLQALVVMLVMSALVFVGVYAIGNPIDVLISPDVTQEIRAQTIARYGLDRPLWEQYCAFLGRLLHGDLGRSFVFNMPVLEPDPVAACRRRWN